MNQKDNIYMIAGLTLQEYRHHFHKTVVSAYGFRYNTRVHHKIIAGSTTIWWWRSSETLLKIEICCYTEKISKP